MHATLSRVLATYSIKSTNGKKSILFNSLLDVVGILKSVFSVTLFLFILNTSVTAGLWAYLAPRCYILSGLLQLSSELCRKIFLHVLAELCRFSASYSHSAGIPQDCPPARTKICLVNPQRLIVNRTMTTWWHRTAKYQKDIWTCSPSTKFTINGHAGWKYSQNDHL